MLRAAEQDRPDVATARRDWQAAQGALDPAKLVFVDETGASTKMAPPYASIRRERRSPPCRLAAA